VRRLLNQNTEIHTQILDNLKQHLHQSLPNDPIQSVYNYCVLPPGKLFRPKLVHAIANDLSKNFKLTPHCDHALLCSFVEIHHAYTLVHDDLPCMDDDDMRRNKPSAHKAFGEWKALLIGDGLLNISYEILSKLKSTNLRLILKIATRCLGPKGLIQGQVLDLDNQMLESFSSIKKTHEFKTARLIQISLLLSYLLIEDPKEISTTPYRTSLEITQLGKYLGLTFQFIDDLSELTSMDLSQHEQEINPWFTFPTQVSLELIKGIQEIDKISGRLGLNHFQQTYKGYITQMTSSIIEGHLNIRRNLKLHSKQKSPDNVLVPVMRLLQRISQRNHFI